MLQRKMNKLNKFSIVFIVFLFQAGCEKPEEYSSIPDKFLVGTGLESKAIDIKKLGIWEAEYILIARGNVSPSVGELERKFPHEIDDADRLKILKERVSQVCPDFQPTGDEIFLRGVPNDYLRFEVVVSKNVSIFFGYR